MGIMKRFFLAGSVVSALVAAIFPALAMAQVVELGQTSPSAVVAPVCPPGTTALTCLMILTRITAFQTSSDGVANTTTVKRDGFLVAFTVGSSPLTSNRSQRRDYIHNLDTRFGGTPQVALTVLRPVGTKSQLKYEVVGESAYYHLIPYLGTVTQFPLTTNSLSSGNSTGLPVKKGDVVALTTPTWAPVLDISLSTSKFGYRQSRTSNCNHPPASSQAQIVNDTAIYKCPYEGTRVEYTATEVTWTNPPKNYVHAPNLGSTGKLSAKDVLGAI
jgi:hypothetical protein